MRQVIIDFLFFRAQNSHPMVYIGLAAVYLVMIGCSISSICKESYGRGTKTFYIILVLAVPLLGMLAYTLHCIWRADYSAVLRFKPQLKQ
jgi:hypothetical protein